MRNWLALSLAIAVVLASRPPGRADPAAWQPPTCVTTLARRSFEDRTPRDYFGSILTESWRRYRDARTDTPEVAAAATCTLEVARTAPFDPPEHVLVLIQAAQLERARARLDSSRALLGEAHTAAQLVRQDREAYEVAVVAATAQLDYRAGKLEDARGGYERAIATCNARPELQCRLDEPLGELAQVEIALGRIDPAIARIVASQKRADASAEPARYAAVTQLAQVAPARAVPLLAHELSIIETMLRQDARGGALGGGGPDMDQNWLLRIPLDSIETAAALGPDDDAMHRLLLTGVLLRKGRAFDLATQRSRQLRANLDDESREKFEHLRRLRRRLAALELAGKDTDERKLLVREVGALDRWIDRTRPSRRDELPAADRIVDATAKALAPGSALVEIALLRPAKVTQKGSEQLVWLSEFDLTFDSPDVVPLDREYVALVLLPDGRVGGKKLGRARDIDDDARRFLAALTDVPSIKLGKATWQAPARRLYDRVLAPIAPLLGNATKVYLSVDGNLQLVPLGALHDGTRHALDRWELTYLTSGRDLLRPASGRVSTSVDVFADPAFGGPASKTPPTARGVLDGAGIPPLPGTRKEAEAIRRMIAGANVRLGAAATEPALLALDRPGILHIATHGVFLDGSNEADGGPDRRALRVRRRPAATANQQTPAAAELSAALVNSGLLLAGAGSGRGAEDGITTALEIADMDLTGTQMVVLSACDSARGAVSPGQGVYGLRRAVLTAGAETLVSTLWQVSDEATLALMERFYRELFSQRGRSDAMRRAQLWMRTQHAHPYFWAAFIVLGRDGPLAAGTGCTKPHR